MALRDKPPEIVSRPRRRVCGNCVKIPSIYVSVTAHEEWIRRQIAAFR
jgi:hypothetical protein